MGGRLSIKKSILSYCQSIWDGRLFKFNDLPEWMKDNEYITDMHRPQVRNSHRSSLMWTVMGQSGRLEAVKLDSPNK